MNINLRQDAPDQTDKVDVNELSEAIEQFKSVGAQILAAEIKLKELKDQEKYISEHVIPDIMEKQNLKTLKLKDGSELSVGKKFYASFKADGVAAGVADAADGLPAIWPNERLGELDQYPQHAGRQSCAVRRAQC